MLTAETDFAFTGTALLFAAAAAVAVAVAVAVAAAAAVAVAVAVAVAAAAAVAVAAAAAAAAAAVVADIRLDAADRQFATRSIIVIHDNTIILIHYIHYHYKIIHGYSCVANILLLLLQISSVPPPTESNNAPSIKRNSGFFWVNPLINVVSLRA